MSKKNNSYPFIVALIVALGGFLMGFDASVISGVIKFVKPEFNLTELQIGWVVSCLTLTATLAMMISGPLSDKFGRRNMLKYAAILYFISAIASALAPSFILLVIARLIGGFGVGASLIIAPMYIAELAPPKIRGKMVSFNQLNIVIGISVAFFSNYLILKWGKSDSALAETLGVGMHNWRWMLGLEAIPAIIYFISLYFVPVSPRWLALNKRDDEALAVLKLMNKETAEQEFKLIHQSIHNQKHKEKARVKDLLRPALKNVLLIGIIIAIAQQLSGINAVFFYAPMIFEQTGIGTDASFIQAIFVGLTNLVFTIVAIWLIDRVGRRALLIYGVSGVVIMMILLGTGFKLATYTVSEESYTKLQEENITEIQPIINQTFTSDLEFKSKLEELLGEEKSDLYESKIISEAISINPWLILIGIIGFVAAFAVSLGPVMWVLFSELFPNYIRGLAISLAGFVNSAISFTVQLVFPWELATLGNAGTFYLYAAFSFLALLFVIAKVPETKGKSLEELEEILVK